MSKLTAIRFAGMDYQFRPASYWAEPSDPLEAILRNVKGKNRRQMIRDFWVRGRFEELDAMFLQDELDEDQRKALGEVHPSFLGGEYLPTYLPHEIEIARIELESVTADVISIRARPLGNGTIGYRIVDEYDTEFRIFPDQAPGALSLEQLVRLIDGANEGDGDGLALAYNRSNLARGAPVLSLRHFTNVSSGFYPDLHRHYDALHLLWLDRAWVDFWKRRDALIEGDNSGKQAEPRTS